jgi:hypothetical protein
MHIHPVVMCPVPVPVAVPVYVSKQKPKQNASSHLRPSNQKKNKEISERAKETCMQFITTRPDLPHYTHYKFTTVNM